MFNNHVRGTASMEGMTAVGPQEWRQHTGATRGDGGQTDRTGDFVGCGCWWLAACMAKVWWCGRGWLGCSGGGSGLYAVCRGCEVDGFLGGTGHHAHRAQSPKNQRRGSPTRQRKIHWRVSILWWVARAHVFFVFPPFVTGFFSFFFEAPVKLELFLYWPVSRCAYGATVFWVVAGSTRSKVHLQRYIYPSIHPSIYLSIHPSILVYLFFFFFLRAFSRMRSSSPR